MKTILRKSLLYKTGVEYGDYTMNHVLGCSHGCKYPCYAYLMAKRFGNIKSYQEWIEPKIVSNTIELLDKEIPKFLEDYGKEKDGEEYEPSCFSIDIIVENEKAVGGVINYMAEHQMWSEIPCDNYDEAWEYYKANASETDLKETYK